MFDAIAGRDPKDPTSLDAERPQVLTALGGASEAYASASIANAYEHATEWHTDHPNLTG